MNPIVEEWRAKSRNGYAGKTDDELILAIGNKYPDYLTNDVFKADYLRVKTPKAPTIERQSSEDYTPEEQDQFRKIIGQEPVSYRDQIMNRPARIMTGMGLEMGSNAAGIARAAGGIIESPFVSGALEMGLEAAQGLTGRQLIPDIVQNAINKRKDAGKELAKASKVVATDLSKANEFINPKLADRAPGLVVGAAVSSLPSIAAAPLGPLGTLGAAALQSFGGTFADATDAYEKDGMSREEARTKAFIPSVTSGLITGAMVRAFGGMERFLGQLGTGKLAEAGTKALIKKAFGAAALEAPEEFFDQLWQGMTARISYDPDKPMLQVWKEALVAAVLGAGAGLLVGGATVAGSTAIKNFFGTPEQPNTGATSETDNGLQTEQQDEQGQTSETTSEGAASLQGEEGQVAPVPRGPKVLPSRAPNPFQPVATQAVPADVPPQPFEVPQLEPTRNLRAGEIAQRLQERSRSRPPRAQDIADMLQQRSRSRPVEAPVLEPATVEAPVVPVAPEPIVAPVVATPEPVAPAIAPVVTPISEDDVDAALEARGVAAVTPVITPVAPTGKTVPEVNKAIKERKAREAVVVPIPTTKSTLEPLLEDEAVGQKSSSIKWNFDQVGVRPRRSTNYKGFDVEVITTPNGVVWKLKRGTTEEAAIEQAESTGEVAERVLNRVDKLVAQDALPADVVSAFEESLSSKNTKASKKKLDGALKKHGLDLLEARKKWLGLNLGPKRTGKSRDTNLFGYLELGQVEAGVKDNSLVSLLEFGAANGTTVISRRIFGILLNFAKAQSIGVSVNLNGASEHYDPASHSISLSPTLGKLREGVIIHEAVHALTSRFIGKYMGDDGNPLSGAEFKLALDRALSDPTVPAEFKKLVRIYLHTAEQRGLTDTLFGQEGSAGNTGNAWFLHQIRNIPYGFLNLHEFIAEAFSDPVFQKTLNDMPGTEPGKSTWTQFIDFLKDLFPYFKTTGTALEEVLHIGAQIMAQDVSAMGKGGQKAYSLESAMATLRATQAEGNPDEIANATENLRKEQASAVTANMPKVQDWVAQQQSMLEQGNKQGSVNLTGPSLQQFRVVQAIVGHPIVKKFLTNPVLHLRESVAALGTAASKFSDLIANGETPQMISAAAREASHFLDSFYEDLFAFRREQDGKVAELLAEKDTLLEGRTESVDATQAMSVLMDDFKDIIYGMVNLTNTQSETAAHKKATDNLSGARQVLKFIAQHVNLASVNSGTIQTVDATVDLINATAQGLMKPEHNNIDQITGGSPEAVRAVAHYLLRSNVLRGRIEAIKDFISDKATATPLSEFKTKLKELIDKGHIKMAINLFSTGYGRTFAAQQASRKASQVALHRIQKILVDVEAMGEVRLILDSLEQGDEFRALSKEIYDKIGAVEHIRTVNAGQWILKPIYEGEQPTVISSLGNKSVAELKELNEWYQKALFYVNDTKHPEYDPVKAAAIREFAMNEGIELDPAYNTEAGHFLPSLPRVVIRTVFGWMGRVDRVPRWIIDGTAGYASEQLHRAEKAYSTVSELTVVISKKWDNQIKQTLKAAMKAHEMGERDYENKVYNPLAASLQSFENPKRLNVGSKTAGWHTILPEDMAYFNASRAYEKALIDMVNSTGDTVFKSVQMSPTGISFKRNGKTVFRLPMETGPGTVHRRLTSIIDWYQGWRSAKTPEAKAEFLNLNLDRILIGYVKDVENHDFVARYNFGPEFKSILREGPILSFDDLVQRTFIKAVENQEEDSEVEMTPELVRDVILGEIDHHFGRWKGQHPDKDSPNKTIMDAWGGDNSFSTERGAQIVPLSWYDLGFVTLGQRMSYNFNAKTGLAIELHNALEAMVAALKAEVQVFETQKLKKEANIQSRSRQAQINGEIFYNFREAKSLLDEVSWYYETFDKVLKAEVGRGGTYGLEDQPFDPNVVFNTTISTMLADPGTQTWNAMGGASRIMLFDIQHRKRNAFAQLTALGPKVALLAWKQGLRLLSHDPDSQYLFKMLSDARFKPVIGKVAEYIWNTAEGIRKQDIDRERLGLTLNMDMVSTLKTETQLWRSGGFTSDESVGWALVPRALNYLARVSNEVMRQGSVGYVDGIINGRALDHINDVEKDHMRRAVEFGGMRHQRALAEGREPYDISDINNRFTDKELVGGRGFTSDGPAALHLRQFMRREGGINIDHEYWKFYQKWVEAGKPARKNGYYGDLRMFDDATYNQLVFGHSKAVNLAAFDTRPLYFRISKFIGRFGVFFGYASDANYALTSIADKESRQTWAMGTVRNLPAVLNAIVVITAIGAMAGWMTDWVRKKVWGKFAAIPNIISDQTAASLFKTILTSFASQQPFYGQFINQIAERNLKRGYDLNSMFVIINEVQDVMSAFNQSIQTGEPVRPVLMVASKYTPVKYLAPRLPQLSGLNNIAQVTNLLKRGAHSASLQVDIPVWRGGRGSQDYADTYAPTVDMWNNIGNGNFEGAIESFKAIRDVYAKDGKGNVEHRAIRTVEASHPINKAFKDRLTTQELNAALERLTPEQRAFIEKHLSFFDRVMTAIKPIGSPPYKMTRDPDMIRSTGSGKNPIPLEFRSTRDMFDPRLELQELEGSSREFF